MVLSNKGFASFVITVFIIYGSTHAKKLIMGSMYFLNSLKCNSEGQSCDDYFVGLGS